MSPLSALANFELLILSDDYSTLKMFTSAWRESRSRLDSTPSIACATDLVRKRKLHGIVVDMGLKGASEFIHQTRARSGQGNPIIVACTGSPQEEQAALTAGANFIVQKPISSGRVFDLLTLSGRVQPPQRRNFLRHQLVAPVTLFADGLQYRALTADLSQRGMSIRSLQTFPLDASLKFYLELRSTTAVAGKGRVMWVNQEGYAGIKFDSANCSNAMPLGQWLHAHGVLLSC